MPRTKKNAASSLQKRAPRKPRRIAPVKLERIPREEAYKRLLAMRGKVHLEYDIDELREDRD